MSPRAAVSFLAAPAPIHRHVLLSFLYPPPALSTLHNLRLFSSSASAIFPQRHHDAFIRTNIQRPFHSTAARRDAAIDNARDHYETLKVAPTATPAEIKKYDSYLTTHFSSFSAYSRPPIRLSTISRKESELTKPQILLRPL